MINARAFYVSCPVFDNGGELRFVCSASIVRITLMELLIKGAADSGKVTIVAFTMQTPIERRPSETPNIH